MNSLKPLCDKCDYDIKILDTTKQRTRISTMSISLARLAIKHFVIEGNKL